MRRRHAILVVLVSALLAGCGKIPDVQEHEPRPIVFAPSVSAGTKALKPDDPTVLFTVGNRAGIFATRVENNIPESVLQQDLHCDSVTPPATPGDPYTGVWNYDNVRYWKDTGDYYFTGVFPTGNNATINSETYYLSLDYQAGSNTDVMVARAYRDASVSKDPVDLEFKHITSAVRFLFGKSSDSPSDQYTLTSFRLENIASTGTFRVPTRITNPAMNPITSSNWTNGAVSIIGAWTADSDADRKNITYPSDSDDPDGYTPMGWYYMVPQTLNSACRVRFSVAYNDEDPVETVLNFYGATDQNSEAGTAWEPNQVYNYFITLTQSGLELTVQAVPWTEVQVTTDDITFEG